MSKMLKPLAIAAGSVAMLTPAYAATGTAVGDGISALMIIGLALGGYFFPTLIAWSRKHRNTLAIFIVNLFLGWTFLGWVAALVWACTCNVRESAHRPLVLEGRPNQQF